MQGAGLLQSAPTSVADRMFYKSFLAIRSGRLYRSLFQLAQSLALGGLLLYSYLDVKQQNLQLDSRIINALVLMIIVSAYGWMVTFIQYKSIYSKLTIYLDLAELTNHLVAGQNIRGLRNFEECTSELIYSGQTMDREQGMSDQTKKLLESITIASIISTVKSHIQFVRKGQGTFALMSVASMVYAIVAMATDPVTVLQIVIFSLYSAYIVLSEIILILLLVGIALLPLICLVGCLYICCCKRSAGTIIDLPQIDATANHIVNVEGDCPICFQSIGVNEKVYVLTCSQKHVFHSRCLSGWVRVKPNCPICRQEIPTRANP